MPTQTQSELLQAAADDWSAAVLADPRNLRLDVKTYQVDGAAATAALCAWLLEQAVARDLGKVILRARARDWRHFLACGFTVEGVIDGFFCGTESAYYLSYFVDPARQTSTALDEEQAILRQVLLAPTAAPPALPAECTVVPGEPALAADMAQLFRRVFVTYPSPVADPDYLADQMADGNAIYRCVVDDAGRLISAAAAELNQAARAAEMTDCATLPEQRGAGLMSILLSALEHDLPAHAIRTAYTMARARSYGMNLVVRRLGYRYGGRQINNCDIAGGLEDMQIWVKSLPVPVHSEQSPRS